ncbi:MAG: PQQ-binding-like beta-propeller repeat protein [Senegalimassilia faecalis]
MDGNYVYVGTGEYVGASTYNNGYLTCINILTGAIAWQHRNADEGYYWNGAVVAGDYAVVSTSAGTVEVLNRSTGAVASTLALGASVNSACVVSSDGSTIYVVSRDGKLHVLKIETGATSRSGVASYASMASGGIISEEKVVDLGLSGSACTPTVADGVMYVGGEVESGRRGACDRRSEELRSPRSSPKLMVLCCLGSRGMAESRRHRSCPRKMAKRTCTSR